MQSNYDRPTLNMEWCCLFVGFKVAPTDLVIWRHIDGERDPGLLSGMARDPQVEPPAFREPQKYVLV